MSATTGSHVLRRFTGTLAMGLAALLMIASDVRFSLRAKTASAIVIEGTSGGNRSLQQSAEAERWENGCRITARVRVAFHRLRLKKGDRITVAYLPDDPTNAVVDQFWQRHYGSVLALSVFGLVAVGEARAFARWRRWQSSGLTRG